MCGKVEATFQDNITMMKTWFWSLEELDALKICRDDLLDLPVWQVQRLTGATVVSQEARQDMRRKRERASASARQMQAVPCVSVVKIANCSIPLPP